MFSTDIKSLASICILSGFFAACSNSPVFVPSSTESAAVMLSSTYGDLLLQIYDKDIDASWELDTEVSNVTVNGSKLNLNNAERHEYLTKQNSFAYLLNLDKSEIIEGVYTVEAILSRGEIQREYKSSYNMEIIFGSAFHYLYSMYQQRNE
ncbi:MAG: hypothetical protein KZQ73_04505 [Candidatus Thiodiazotropha sp. (ex Semelilucina semeliformis)]|nr:hypothetical protein [Candidatus Thiodiazotropha sp. (ex Semelilucina semeliformis)]